MSVPYHSVIPRDFKQNLRFRRKLLRKADRSASLRRELRRAAASDLLFFIDLFIWTYDPFARFGAVEIPFIAWPYQERALHAIEEAVGRHDIVCEKSRDMGATWMFLIVFLWRVMFQRMQSFQITSYKAELVDNQGDLDALIPKVQFMVEHLPNWLTPACVHRERRLMFPDTKGVFKGEGTTERIGRAGRAIAALLDEFAWFDMRMAFEVAGGTQSTVPCRCFNSTPHGAGTAYELMRQRTPHKIRLHWSDHPVKRRGLYTSRYGRLSVLDHDYRFLPDYEFKLDDRLRSPWYDEEEPRYPTDALRAQELDIDVTASGGPFFDVNVLDTLQHGIGGDSTVTRPTEVGEIEFDELSGEFKGWRRCDNGRWRIWCGLDGAGLAPDDTKYGVGADVSTGRGASNSCAVVVNLKNGHQVAEFACSRTSPEKFAALLVASCRMFKGGHDVGARLIFEANGPGLQCGGRLYDMGYVGSNVYRRKAGGETGDPSNKLGWWTRTENKREMLADLSWALGTGNFIARSRELLDECRYYRYISDKEVAHTQSTVMADPTGARTNHGDRVIAASVVNQLIKGLQRYTARREPKLIIPRDCVAAELQRSSGELEEALLELTPAQGWGA